MQTRDLAILMIRHSEQLNRDLTREQQLLWVIGVLSSQLTEANQEDDRVFERLQARIDQMYEERREDNG